MKIVQVGTGFLPVLPSGTGGVEKYVHYLSAALQRLGHEVTVIDLPVSSPACAPYRRVDLPLLWRYDFNLAAHALRGLLFGWRVARWLKVLIAEEGVDVVNFQGQFTAVTGIPVGRRDGVSAVLTMHNSLWSDARACQSPWQRAKFWLEQRAEARADAIISVSRTVAEHRVRFFGVDPRKIAAVPCGVDDYYFEAEAASSLVKSRFSPDDKPLILQVARLAPYKNQLATATAFKAVIGIIPNAGLVFASSVDDEGYFRTLERILGATDTANRAVFAGPVIDELRQLYGLAKIVVLPSLQENSPLAALEAMAQGKAIVASDIAPLREMLPEGTAVLVARSDHDALGQALIRLLRDDRAREQMGARARRRAYDVYRWERVAQRIAQVYENLVSGRPASNGVSESSVRR